MLFGYTDDYIYIIYVPIRFANWQVDAIRKADSEALVSVGAWKAIANTDSYGFHDLYKDECLVSAGGRTNVSV